MTHCVMYGQSDANYRIYGLVIECYTGELFFALSLKHIGALYVTVGWKLNMLMLD